MSTDVEVPRHPRAGTPVARYVYQDAEGQAVLAASRFEKPDGSKFFLPFDVVTGAWKAPDLRPLYRLPEIIAAPENMPVILVEGEKCADALAGLGYLATTTFGGANAPHKTDLGPLRGRPVIIWPDHDAPGARYADRLAATLHSLCKEAPRIVPVSDRTLCSVANLRHCAATGPFPKGWDAADAVAGGWTRQEIDRLLALAVSHAKAAPGVADDAASGDACAEFELWHTPDGEPFATFEQDGHAEHMPIGSRAFEALLSHRYWKAEGKPLSKTATEDQVRGLIARARFEGACHPCFTRIGENGGKLYLDLGRDDWSAIEIAPGGWSHVARPAARFARTGAVRPLPVPDAGGADIALLKQFLNYATEEDFIMLVGFLVACLRPRGPYPILILNGEQGSAKSTTTQVLKRLVDPAKAGSRSAPRSEQDLVIAASHQHLLCYDNLSKIPGWLSDALCRVATGSGFGTRRLHTNTEEVLIEVARPVILNGIPDLAGRPDLLSRAIVLTLPVIPDGERQFEDRFWQNFDAAAPRILAALLDGAASALARERSTELPWRPRMADFARWGTAAEPGLGWPSGGFLAAYRANIEAAQDIALGNSVVADAVFQLIEPDREWKGTATDFIRETRRRFPDLAGDGDFPSHPNRLKPELTRLAPLLRDRGVAITHSLEGKARTRVIAIKR